ncbi:hypothetical protein [Halococcus saccharolyticus]|uniref:Uncharacterized protein n=1 Tax=Halococcus saccharolyticus DSM 5350 TaxID=1227455 RepID=M0MA30_9EURY|nr:hypothetical protein [Halococcus saccharolyticus]EMA42642.1 hypothetical protein C449_15908 [Halococcus saccharolyticus DSM 5350]
MFKPTLEKSQGTRKHDPDPLKSADLSPDRYPGGGWGGTEEGTRRIDDCIDEASFGPGSDDEEDEGAGL